MSAIKLIIKTYKESDERRTFSRRGRARNNIAQSDDTKAMGIERRGEKRREANGAKETGK